MCENWSKTFRLKHDANNKLRDVSRVFPTSFHCHLENLSHVFVSHFVSDNSLILQLRLIVLGCYSDNYQFHYHSNEWHEESRQEYAVLWDKSLFFLMKMLVENFANKSEQWGHGVKIESLNSLRVCVWKSWLLGLIKKSWKFNDFQSKLINEKKIIFTFNQF